MSDVYRVTPAEGIQVDEVYIPGDINVCVPFEMIQTDKRYWSNALDFIPERWTERKEEMGTDESLFIPFSAGQHANLLLNMIDAELFLGVYRCPGDRLAMMGMRTAISSIAQDFDITFAQGENGKSFIDDRRDAYTTVLAPLQLQFTPRKKH